MGWPFVLGGTQFAQVYGRSARATSGPSRGLCAPRSS
jgi:hypothetical protein